MQHPGYEEASELLGPTGGAFSRPGSRHRQEVGLSRAKGHLLLSFIFVLLVGGLALLLLTIFTPVPIS